MKKLTYIISLSLVSFFAFSDDENSGGIEEVIVTAERQASSIQDTAISITAFDENLIEDLNLRNQEDLQNHFSELHLFQFLQTNLDAILSFV